jgi:hypothetical protein
MTSAMDVQLPDRCVSATYHCVLCGAEAGQLQLTLREAGAAATLVARGLVGEATQGVAHDTIIRLVRVLTVGNARELYQLDTEWASFYCPECDAVYCKAHWRTRIQFGDDDEMPGWYDCTYGTCPNGHVRIVDD